MRSGSIITQSTFTVSDAVHTTVHRHRTRTVRSAYVSGPVYIRERAWSRWVPGPVNSAISTAPSPPACRVFTLPVGVSHLEHGQAWRHRCMSPGLCGNLSRCINIGKRQKLHVIYIINKQRVPQSHRSRCLYTSIFALYSRQIHLFTICPSITKTGIRWTLIQGSRCEWRDALHNRE